MKLEYVGVASHFLDCLILRNISQFHSIDRRIVDMFLSEIKTCVS
jgi:hypothetical protein